MYNESVDVWSIGCLLVELLSGEPLFPGDSDIDQIYHITKCLGNLITYHRELFNTNSLFRGVKLPVVRRVVPIQQRFPKIPSSAVDFIQTCLILDPKRRPDSGGIISHAYFNDSKFINTFLPHLSTQVRLEYKENVLLQKLGVIVYGFRHFPPTPIPEEVVTSASPTSSPSKKETGNSVTKRKLKRSSHLVADTQSPLEINPIEKLLLELQAIESRSNRDLGSHDPSQSFRKDLVRIPDSIHHVTNGTVTSELGGREGRHSVTKQQGPRLLANSTRSPARRHTPENLTPADSFSSPKRSSDPRHTRPQASYELPLTPQQVSQTKRKHTSTDAAALLNKTAASFLPNLHPKEKSSFKNSQLRALPNPETILSSRKWNEKQHASLSKLDQPKVPTNISQLTPLELSYIPRNDSDDSFIV